MHFRFFRRIVTAFLLVSLVIIYAFLFYVSNNEEPSPTPRFENGLPVLSFELKAAESTSGSGQTHAQTHSELDNHQMLPDRSTMKPDPHPKTEKRRSLLIFGDDRSGTTFLTRMFSEDPQNFAVYEPLWITHWWKKFPEVVYGNWEKNVRDVISSLLTCHFPHSAAGTRFLAYTKKKWADGLFHNPFIVPPFCNQDGAENCPHLSSKFAEEVCVTKFKHSVVKAALVRVPDRKLSKLIPQILKDNPETEIKVLHVVRDPRGSVNSRINSKWIPDYQSKAFPALVRDTCQGITPNVKFGQSLEGWIRDRYKLVRYQDIANTPLKTAQELYDFAGFQMPESLKDWIIESTNPSEDKLAKEAKKVFSTIRNSTANVEKWRQQSSIERNRIIQRECSELFDLLELDRL